MIFHNHRYDPELPCILMKVGPLGKAPCLRLTPDLKRNSYILTIDKDAGKIVGSLCRSSKYLVAPAILYLKKTARNGVLLSYSGGSCPDRTSSFQCVRSRLRAVVGEELFSTLQPLSHRRYVTRFFLRNTAL